jgi:hypothetical protein
MDSSGAIELEPALCGVRQQLLAASEPLLDKGAVPMPGSQSDIRLGAGDCRSEAKC